MRIAFGGELYADIISIRSIRYSGQRAIDIVGIWDICISEEFLSSSREHTHSSVRTYASHRPAYWHASRKRCIDDSLSYRHAEYLLSWRSEIDRGLPVIREARKLIAAIRRSDADDIIKGEIARIIADPSIMIDGIIARCRDKQSSCSPEGIDGIVYSA